MKFKSKPEAYLYSLYILGQIRDEIESSEVHNPRKDTLHDKTESIELIEIINSSIEKIQIEVENHQQDPRIIAEILLTLLSKLSNNNQKQILSKLSFEIQQGNYEQALQNELGRRFESQIQIELLLSPTDAMMASVKKMSEKIVEILDKKEYLQEQFLGKLKEKGKLSFGSYREAPSYQDPESAIRVRDVLLQNDKKDLIKIMHMHFKFSQYFARILDGEYAEFSKSMFEISDKRIYKSICFKDRGRDGEIKHIKTQRMGISSSNQRNLYNDSLPEDSSSWVADANAQAAKRGSPFVEKLVNSDTPYVSGPSGMTSLFIGQIIGFKVYTNKEEQQHYLAVVTAYIVSGGFHSLHEVLSPVALCLPELELIPGYQASLRSSDEAPNYHVFYSEMERIDPQFGEVRKKGWEKLLDFFEHDYLPCSDVGIAQFVDNNKDIIATFKQAYEKCPDNPKSWISAVIDTSYKDEKEDLPFRDFLDKLMNQHFEKALIKYLQLQEKLQLKGMLDLVINRYQRAVALFKRAWMINAEDPVGQMKKTFENSISSPSFKGFMNVLDRVKGFADELIAHIKKEEDLNNQITSLLNLLTTDQWVFNFLQEAYRISPDNMLSWMQEQINNSESKYNIPECISVYHTLLAVPGLEKELIANIAVDSQSQNMGLNQSNEHLPNNQQEVHLKTRIQP
jgi:hypothetical protein